ncbi:MAG: prepilin-type N-terminal cleavage/methylation domain-containing protein [Polyangiales bacterium]
MEHLHSPGRAVMEHLHSPGRALIERLHSSRHRRAQGFTLIEVMMALAVLGVSALGLVSLQRATLVANADAMQYTVAASIAQSWVERLKRDGAAWNHPTTAVTTDDTACAGGKDINSSPGSGPCSGTVWLAMVEGSANSWFVPSAQYLTTGTPSMSMNQPSGTLDGAPAASVSDIVYCVNIRLNYLVPDQVIRADVRVYWPKRTHDDLSALGITASTPCALDNAVLNAVGGIGGDENDFHWVYTVDQVEKVTGQ